MFMFLKSYVYALTPFVIGTAFYIMEFMEGRIFIDPKLSNVALGRRSALYRATAKALLQKTSSQNYLWMKCALLASLHSTDVDPIDLEKYGRRANYCKRLVRGLIGAGKAERNPKMFELVDWLRKSIRAEDSTEATSGLVHGDFRIDNLVFHLSEDRFIDIIDWELSTLGNQMCDVAYNCIHYIVNVQLDKKHVSEGLKTAGLLEGILSRSVLLSLDVVSKFAQRPF